jgi:hypothetical protein
LKAEKLIQEEKENQRLIDQDFQKLKAQDQTTDQTNSNKAQTSENDKKK